MSNTPKCDLCGEPMPQGEEVFKYHGYSGPCPKPPLAKELENAFGTREEMIARYRRLEELLAEKDKALAGLLNAEHCPHCGNQGVIVIQTGGCDSDGENDTRCREQEQCEWCYTTKNSFFNVRASLPQSAKHDGK